MRRSSVPCSHAYRIRFLDLHVAFVREKAVKHESRIAVGAFDGHAVEGSVIIREEGIEFESEVAEAYAIIFGLRVRQ